MRGGRKCLLFYLPQHCFEELCCKQLGPFWYRKVFRPGGEGSSSPFGAVILQRALKLHGRESWAGGGWLELPSSLLSSTAIATCPVPRLAQGLRMCCRANRSSLALAVLTAIKKSNELQAGAVLQAALQ